MDEVNTTTPRSAEASSFANLISWTCRRFANYQGILVVERTALIDQVRAILLERGFVAPQCKRKLIS